MAYVCLPWITLLVIGLVLLQIGIEIGELYAKRPVRSNVKGERDDDE